eukprot:jgi/Chrzof1/6625/Cz19g03060.t1
MAAQVTYNVTDLCQAQHPNDPCCGQSPDGCNDGVLSPVGPGSCRWTMNQSQPAQPPGGLCLLVLDNCNASSPADYDSMVTCSAKDAARTITTLDAFDSNVICNTTEICDGRGGKLCDTCISGMEAVRTDFKAKLADLQHCNSWATNSANLTNALLHDVQMQAVQLAKMVMQLASPCLDGVDSLSLYLNESTATDPLGVCQVAGLCDHRDSPYMPSNYSSGNYSLGSPNGSVPMFIVPNSGLGPSKSSGNDTSCFGCVGPVSVFIQLVQLGRYNYSLPDMQQYCQAMVVSTAPSNMVESLSTGMLDQCSMMPGGMCNSPGCVPTTQCSLKENLMPDQLLCTFFGSQDGCGSQPGCLWVPDGILGMPDCAQAYAAVLQSSKNITQDADQFCKAVGACHDCVPGSNSTDACRGCTECRNVIAAANISLANRTDADVALEVFNICSAVQAAPGYTDNNGSMPAVNITLLAAWNANVTLNLSQGRCYSVPGVICATAGGDCFGGRGPCNNGSLSCSSRPADTCITAASNGPAGPVDPTCQTEPVCSIVVNSSQPAPQDVCAGFCTGPDSSSVLCNICSRKVQKWNAQMPTDPICQLQPNMPQPPGMPSPGCQSGVPAYLYGFSGSPPGYNNGYPPGYGVNSTGPTPMPGGVMPGGMMPGGVMPGSLMPGGIMPGGLMPGGVMPGGVMPGGVMPGGVMPGGIMAGSPMPGGVMPGGVMPGGVMPGGVMPGGVMPGGVMPGGIMPGSPMPGGVMPGGVMPGGVMPGGVMPGGIMPGSPMPGGVMPGSLMPGGVMPGSPMPGGMMPGSPMPGGVMPGGVMPGGVMPGSPMPGGIMPGGVMPGSVMPGGPMPNGSMAFGYSSIGPMPTGYMPGGVMPDGTMPTGYMPGGPMPNGPMPNMWMPAMSFLQMKKLSCSSFFSGLYQAKDMCRNIPMLWQDFMDGAQQGHFDKFCQGLAHAGNGPADPGVSSGCMQAASLAWSLMQSGHLQQTPADLQSFCVDVASADSCQQQPFGKYSSYTCQPDMCCPASGISYSADRCKKPCQFTGSCRVVKDPCYEAFYSSAWNHNSTGGVCAPSCTLLAPNATTQVPLLALPLANSNTSGICINSSLWSQCNKTATDATECSMVVNGEDTCQFVPSCTYESNCTKSSDPCCGRWAYDCSNTQLPYNVSGACQWMRGDMGMGACAFAPFNCSSPNGTDEAAGCAAAAAASAVGNLDSQTATRVCNECTLCPASDPTDSLCNRCISILNNVTNDYSKQLLQAARCDNTTMLNSTQAIAGVLETARQSVATAVKQLVHIKMDCQDVAKLNTYFNYSMSPADADQVCLNAGQCHNVIPASSSPMRSTGNHSSTVPMPTGPPAPVNTTPDCSNCSSYVSVFIDLVNRFRYKIAPSYLRDFCYRVEFYSRPQTLGSDMCGSLSNSGYGCSGDQGCMWHNSCTVQGQHEAKDIFCSHFTQVECQNITACAWLPDNVLSTSEQGQSPCAMAYGAVLLYGKGITSTVQSFCTAVGACQGCSAAPFAPGDRCQGCTQCRTDAAPVTTIITGGKSDADVAAQVYSVCQNTMTATGQQPGQAPQAPGPADFAKGQCRSKQGVQCAVGGANNCDTSSGVCQQRLVVPLCSDSAFIYVVMHSGMHE